MKLLYLFFFAALSAFIISCKKTSFITSTDALLFTSADTLHFDTVFTGAGSITQSFKIFNPNDQKLLISDIQLAGGENSSFKINVDGSPGVNFSNIEIAPNDSMYVFVAANINHNTTNLPFLIQDSLQINYNGNVQWVQLDAYGQNAYYLRNAIVAKDTSWSNELPVVILEPLMITQGKTLTIAKGVHVYCHADARIIVNGSLHISGENHERIIFSGDRLDDYYKDLPGSWQGIVFSESSENNFINYADFKNAKDAITVNGFLNPTPKLNLNGCIINNASGSGILANHSIINAVNCLIYNCESNIQITAGGNYNFINCTVTGYSTNFVSHSNPVLNVSNADSANQTFPLNANFINSIFYGEEGIVEDEIAVQQSGNTPFTLNFENDLYKGSGGVGNFVSCIQNADPLFANIDAGKNEFDFHLQQGSPCINTGKKVAVVIDLDGIPRDSNPDIGCYESQ
jgi:hypothetical protein